jgi:iron complex transport system permease protein
MRNYKKIGAGLGLSCIVICGAVCLGSSPVSLYDTLLISIGKIFRLPLTAGVDPKNVSIVWQLRMPRVLLAFMTGGALSISGAVIQSVLKNPLASPYTLGVSSGVSLGAAVVILGGISPLLGGFTLPAAGFLSGLAAMYALIAFSSRIDKTISNNTIILLGMVFSLFISAILTTMTALAREELKTLLFWQMGSFALKGWAYVRLMVPFFIAGLLGLSLYTKEMDILTFGEEQAKSAGLDTQRVRKKLFVYTTILTGAAVSLSGIIGFVDLIAPHAARKIVGSNHKYVIPMSFCIGGSLMVITDLIARTIISPSELPVGAITAIIGAPFFAWIYFRKR